MINQKAREIAERAFDSTASYPEKRFQAARLGIIEGRRQAFEEALEALNDDEVAEAMDCNKVEKYAVHKSAINLAKEAIRALIEESKG
jgi:hypothetical protein